MSNIQSQALRIGTQLAVYEIKELIGSHQSEIIYRAWNKRLDTMVILKEFFPFDYVSRDADSQSVLLSSAVSEFVFEFGLGNFIQVNEKLLEIQHPGAQAALNILELNQTVYLVLSDPKGSLLSDYLSNAESYTEDELKKPLGSLLDTINVFHNADIIHGDIHPVNILIQDNGEPVLLNFASARQEFARYIEKPSSELHTGYASPEQYLTRGEIDASSDLYALGGVLYRCISGVDPEDGEARMSEFNKNNSDPLKTAMDITDSGVSNKFLRTVDWMLQPENTARPQSAGEVIATFRKSKSSSTFTAGSLTRAKGLLDQIKERGAKAKTYSIASLAVSVLTAVILGSMITSWYFRDEEEQNDLTAIEASIRQEGASFGRAVAGGSKKTNSKQLVPDDAERSNDEIAIKQEKSQKLKNDERKLMSEYMAKAEESFAQFYLTTPAEKNAYYYYKQVLGIDPNHEDAKKGTENIFNQYVSLIEKAIDAGDNPLAKLYLGRIKEVSLGASSQKETIEHFEGVLQGIDPRPAFISIKE